MPEAREGPVINLSPKSNIINPERQQSSTNEPTKPTTSLSAFTAIVNKLSPQFGENELIQPTTSFTENLLPLPPL